MSKKRMMLDIKLHVLIIKMLKNEKKSNKLHDIIADFIAIVLLSGQKK